MGSLYAPNGLRIVGTAETIPGVAQIWNDTVRRQEDGSYQFEYLGGTVIDWDGQQTRKRVNALLRLERIFVDSDGVEWLESQLKFREETNVDGDTTV